LPPSCDIPANPEFKLPLGWPAGTCIRLLPARAAWIFFSAAAMLLPYGSHEITGGGVGIGVFPRKMTDNLAHSW
jgi:hypothetical protein